MKQFVNLGGLCQRKKIHDISEVVIGVDIVVNCTGIRAKQLVHDVSLIATRGQNVLIKAPHIRKSMSMVNKNDYTYVIPRTDGTVILGTTKDDDAYVKKKWQTYSGCPQFFFPSNAEVNEKTTLDILQRAIKCCPELSPDGIEGMHVLETIVGLRPTRKGGPRIQNEFHGKFFFMMVYMEMLIFIFIFSID